MYHLGLSSKDPLILPFLRDATSFRAQVSAARALAASPTPAAKQQLLLVLQNPKARNFTKTVVARTLAAYHPRELKARLQQLARQVSDEENGFGAISWTPGFTPTYLRFGRPSPVWWRGSKPDWPPKSPVQLCLYD